jgi:hypothetical protein
VKVALVLRILHRDDYGPYLFIKKLNDKVQCHHDSAKFQQDFLNEAIKLANILHQLQQVSM